MTGYDFIVVGAGSAGAALAARLSEQPSARVLLVEAGPDYRAVDTPPEIQSLNWLDSLRRPDHYWPGLTARLTNLREPVLYVRGRGVGGSSAINAAGAVRGIPGDYERWAAAGCNGWSWVDVLPSFIRLEDDIDYGELSYHGRGGPITIQRVPEARWSSIALAFRDAALEVGHPYCPDINAPDATGVYPGPLTARGHIRVSTNDGYLEPARDRTNLTVVGQLLVDRVRFAQQRACGIESLDKSGRRVFEGDQVILAAGAVHSPTILMRSGVGPPDVLRPLGIDVVAERTGVGGNLSDHPIICLRLPLVDRPHTRDGRWSHGCGLRASSTSGVGDDLGYFPAYAPAPRDEGAIWVALLDPDSRGRVLIDSPDPVANPVIDFDMLRDSRDSMRLREGVVHALELVNSSTLRALVAGGMAIDSSGRRLSAANISDRWLREHCDAYFHAVGSCRMGDPYDPWSVVDADCKVIGVESLRVVDASVVPMLPRAPVHLTTVMCAEQVVRRMQT